MEHQDTRNRLLDAAETVIRGATSRDNVSVRRIVAEAGTNISSISYHFGSLEELCVACAKRVYRRLNAQRLTELQSAATASAPRPPELHQIIRALIGTSVRWSLDPVSPYAVFHYLSHLSSLSDHPEAFDSMARDVDHHRVFVHYLHRAAPWFTEAEIGWRLAAALGVRTQFTRQPARCAILTGGPIAENPEHVLDELCEIIAAMFQRPQRGRPGTPTRQTLSNRSSKVSNVV
jgi:AcrR family transcriptional regulator